MSIKCIRMKIGKTPYCYWDYKEEIKRKNISHINGIDPEYFIYQAETHWKNFNDLENNHHAAVGLRLTYHHSLETLFSLVCAAIQAPNAVHFWQLKNQVKDVKDITKAINYGYTGFAYFNNSNGYVDWKTFCQFVFRYSFNDLDVLTNTISKFTEVFQRLAGDFTEDNMQNEYNSIKHGYRGKIGGFVLSFGLEEIPGIPVKNEDMEVFGGSKWGAKYHIAELIGNKTKSKFPNYKVKTCSNNWEPENIYYRIHLVSICIRNIKSQLLIFNGIEPKNVEFTRYTDDNIYLKSWERACVISSITENANIPDNNLSLFSKEEINEACDIFMKNNREK